MSETLKSCPFCGSPEVERRSWDDARVSGFILHAIHCYGCGAQSKWHQTAGQAIELWNRRAEPQGEHEPAPRRLGLSVQPVAWRRWMDGEWEYTDNLRGLGTNPPWQALYAGEIPPEAPPVAPREPEK